MKTIEDYIECRNCKKLVECDDFKELDNWNVKKKICEECSDNE